MGDQFPHIVRAESHRARGPFQFVYWQKWYEINVSVSPFKVSSSFLSSTLKELRIDYCLLGAVIAISIIQKNCLKEAKSGPRF